MENPFQIVTNVVTNSDVVDFKVLGADDVVENSVILSSVVGETKKEIKSQDGKSQVIDAYWVEFPDSDIPTTVLKYKSDDYAYLHVKFNFIAVGSKILIKIFEYDTLGSDDLIVQTVSSIKGEAGSFPIKIDGKAFSKGIDEKLLKLYAKVYINNKFEGDFCNNESKYLKVQIVRYVPTIMKANNLNTGFKMQESWFYYSPNSDYKKRVNIGILNFNYFMRFERFSDFVGSILLSKSWLTIEAKKEIRVVINKELVSKNKILPNNIPKITNFGNYTKKIVLNERGEKVPEYDAYYVVSKNYNESLLSELDDMYAALGSFNLHLSVYGSISYIDENTCKIQLNKLGMHIQDNFDFAYSGPVNAVSGLGFWSPSSNKVSKLAVNDEYLLVRNGDFEEYRTIAKAGGDFNAFSDVRIFDINDSFEANTEFDLISRRNLFII